MEALKTVYYYLGYHAANVVYGFRSKTIREEALYDRLRINGISTVNVNMALDRLRVPRIARLPKVLFGRDHLTDRINSTLMGFSTEPENKPLSREEKSKRLAIRISEDLQAELAFDPDFFLYMMKRK